MPPHKITGVTCSAFSACLCPNVGPVSRFSSALSEPTDCSCSSDPLTHSLTHAGGPEWTDRLFGSATRGPFSGSSIFDAADLNSDGVVSYDEFTKTIGPQFAALMMTQGGVHVGAIDWGTAMKMLHDEQRNGSTGHIPMGYIPRRGYSGGRGGGGGGGGGGCFAKGTPVVMADGSLRPIETVRVGEETAGGRVISTMVFDAADAAPLFLYKGIVVTADHAVRDRDGADPAAFVRVHAAAGSAVLPMNESNAARHHGNHRSSPASSKSVALATDPASSDDWSLLYDLIVTKHVIVTPAAEFSDYLEVDLGASDYAELLERLNQIDRPPAVLPMA